MPNVSDIQKAVAPIAHHYGCRRKQFRGKNGVESEIFLHINILIWIMNQRGIRYSMIYLN